VDHQELKDLFINWAQNFKNTKCEEMSRSISDVYIILYLAEHDNKDIIDLYIKQGILSRISVG
jgi:hypothetical protein